MRTWAGALLLGFAYLAFAFSEVRAAGEGGRKGGRCKGFFFFFIYYVFGGWGVSNQPAVARGRRLQEAAGVQRRAPRSPAGRRRARSRAAGPGEEGAGAPQVLARDRDWVSGLFEGG